MTDTNYKSLYNPPGGILIWIIILLEVITFVAGLVVFAVMRSNELVMFEQSQQLLDQSIGLTNTLVLITGGFFMANALHQLKLGENQKSFLWMMAAILSGIVFMTLKGVEYSDKLAHGYGLEHNSFFTYYWLLTGFHFVHVFIGVVILCFLAVKTRNGSYSRDNFFDVETGGAFWHLCDLIWLLLFPVIYLL